MVLFLLTLFRYPNSVHPLIRESQYRYQIGTSVQHRHTCDGGSAVQHPIPVSVDINCLHRFGRRQGITKADKCHFLQVNNRNDFSSICFAFYQTKKFTYSTKKYRLLKADKKLKFSYGVLKFYRGGFLCPLLPVPNSWHVNIVHVEVSKGCRSKLV